MVIKQYTRTYNETHHELEKTGRTHAEMVEERAKEKCEKIWIEQLFRKSPGSKSAPNIVVVSGVAGIGKTTMVQKIMFDWARGTQNKRFTFVFLFKFRDLNLLDDKTEPQMHLTRLIVRYYKYLNDVKLREILQKPEHLLFILDGLDEYKHKLDFTHKKLCSDPEQFFPVHVLITSLIRRTLLKGCSVLITSRPTALESLDMGTVDRFAEILGFFPKQRLMYFKKFFGDEDLGSEAFQYVEENAILYTMCFNPSYCWIICSVLRNYFTMNEEDRKKAPKTVTELFVMFLYNILTNHKRHAEDQRGILVKLGKMAFHGVANRILVFYDKFEMFSFGLKSVDSSPFLSGFLKEILQKENTEECTTYTFFHLTLQEFMAACSFFLDSSDDIEKLLERLDSCADGRFEIFTRFLAGLARYSLTKQLEEILGWFHRKSLMKILQWVKEKAERALGSKDPSELLRVCHWLYETQNKKLIRDAIGKDLKLSLSSIILSPLDCAVLGSVIKCCGELEELRLYKINLTLESMKRLAPGLSCCRNVLLLSCELTSESCEALSSAVSSEHSHLTELDLTGNKLGDSGVCLLCKGLRSPKCKLEILGLVSCSLTSGSCEALSLALSSKHSNLIELRLTGNNLEDLGVRLLCEGLRSPLCKLQTMWLVSCGLTRESCEALSSILSSENSHLTELDLTGNKLEDSGTCLLCEGLRSPNCKLKKLGLKLCGLTSGCCEALWMAICTEHCQLTELNLEHNKLKDLLLHPLREMLTKANCKLKTLRLSASGISDSGKRNLESLEEELSQFGLQIVVNAWE
ncbi:NACHT, LRR and PYD domains-containing protein 12-like [Polypterus senegalus]|uniref:NACHT, LRR and PYD domains-containing protein 12-like n=1 Tax=Polypterus senegalus TaxID=55291 RepID=UPI001965994D|nr:NACHT, LRR and PYD domains-containing protein 12-like [Polypterus senegalus]